MGELNMAHDEIVARGRWLASSNPSGAGVVWQVWLGFATHR